MGHTVVKQGVPIGKATKKSSVLPALDPAKIKHFLLFPDGAGASS